MLPSDYTWREQLLLFFIDGKARWQARKNRRLDLYEYLRPPNVASMSVAPGNFVSV